MCIFLKLLSFLTSTPLSGSHSIPISNPNMSESEPPLIGAKLHLSTALSTAYAKDHPFQCNIKKMNTTHTSIRRIRGDGSCFYRAFLFRLLEVLLEDKNLYKTRYEDLFRFIEESLDRLGTLGYDKMALEPFHEVLLDLFTSFKENCTSIYKDKADPLIFAMTEGEDGDAGKIEESLNTSLFVICLNNLLQYEEIKDTCILFITHFFKKIER